MRSIHKAAVSFGALLVSLGAATPAMAFDSGSAPDHPMGCMFFADPLDQGLQSGTRPDIEMAPDYQGQIGIAAWSDAPPWDLASTGMSDRISALYVPFGCNATLFDDVYFDGAYTSFPPGYYDLSGNSWEDQAKSVMCDCSDPRFTRSFSFDGSSNYADAPDGTWFTPGGGFTISAWVKVDATTKWSRVIDFGNGPYADGVILIASHGTTGKPAFHVYNGSSGSVVDSSVAIPNGVWTHLAAVYDGHNHGYLYVNGDLVGENGSMLAPNAVTRTKNYIGRSNWSADAYFHGSIADLRIFSDDLSVDEVRRLMDGDEYSDTSWVSIEEARYRAKNGSTLYDMSRNQQDATYF